MKDIWVIGFGSFGQRAVSILSQKEDNQLTIVDISFENIQQVQDKCHRYINIDGVSFLNENLYPGNEPDWIVPALPVHLAAEWSFERLKSNQLRKITLPSELESLVPNPFKISPSVLCVSYADFVCPDNCTEPLNKCPVTNKPRKGNMFELLQKISLSPFEPLVVRSFQLAPGIGGYSPKQLFSLLNKLEQRPGQYLVCTACRCHGVITSLERL